MAAEWDNLIPDRKERPINGSFNTNKGRGKIKSSEASDEESLLSDKEYIVTEYVMEYTDIFEASMDGKTNGNETMLNNMVKDDDSASDKEIVDTKDHKLAFIDVQEGDIVTEVQSNVTGYSAEGYLYENKNVDSESGESSSEGYPDIPEDHGDDEEQTGEHRDIRLPSLDEHEAEKEESISESDLITAQVNSIDIESQDELSMSPRSEDEHLNDKVEQVDDEETEEKVEVIEEEEMTENDALLNKQKDNIVKKVEKQHSKKEVVKTQSETRPLLTSSPEPPPSEEDHSSSTQRKTKVPSSTTKKTHSTQSVPVKKKASPIDPSLQGRKKVSSTQAKDKHVQQRSSHKKNVVSSNQDSSKMHHTQDNGTSTQTTSSMNHSPSKEKKPFSPKAYPGKVVKSVAIGTDDDTDQSYSSDTYDNKMKQKERVKDNFEMKQTMNARKEGKTSRKHLHRNGGENETSDAHFFKGRLTQTSKRPPKRHVWLCRDSEIHRLIAEKASVLRRFKDEGITSGKRRLKQGFPNYSEVDVLGLPSVGFSGQTKDDSHRTSLPYSKHPSSRINQENHDSDLLSEDDDERTNRVGVKTSKASGGTFAVGLASRRDKHLKTKHDSLTSKDDHLADENGDGCELCAAEAREKEKHEKKLMELEEAAKAGPHHPRNLMLGIVYSAKFLGSTNLMSPNAPNKSVRLQQAQEAINRIKVPDGEEQPTSDVDLFISTERIKVVSAEQKQTLIDHHLKTISFIADIGKIIVVMARLSMEDDIGSWSGKMPDFKSPKTEKTAKVVCHVLETEEAQTVAKTVGQAFSIAYHEFLKVNRLNLDELEEAEYNGILEQQKILGEELTLLADETKTKEVVIHKKYGESLSMMIVESGWGSMIPTVVIAHLDNKGVAAKSGQLNVGNQILAVNNQSLVGLPLLECQNIIKAMRYEERVALKVVCCPPTVEICVNRPDTKYQLGFSVQNGMICSLMRGGIAERGGVRVGHKIIELNGESVVAASHHHIVDILQTKIGELQMKTMPITLYKLLVGLEIPQYL